MVGTVRRADSVADLVQKYPDTFRRELLDVTDAAAIRDVVDRSFTSLGRIDVVVSNAGYGLFGAAEELSDDQVTHIIATNLTGSIQLIRAALPHLRAQGSGRQVADVSLKRLKTDRIDLFYQHRVDPDALRPAAVAGLRVTWPGGLACRATMR